MLTISTLKLVAILLGTFVVGYLNGIVGTHKEKGILK